MAKETSKGLRKYDLMLIVKATLPDPQKKTALKKVEDVIKSLGGNKEAENIWGRRVLSFPIKKQTEGYYVNYDILLPPDQTTEFSRLLMIDANVLRFFLRNVDEFDTISTSVKVKAKSE